MSEKQTFEIKYQDDQYDLSDFLRNHPGGSNYLEFYENKEIEKRMENLNHSKAAYYLMKEYRKYGRKEESSDLENLVDWSKPMLTQVGKLGLKYNEWVLSPVDRKLILFGNPILESLTITPWYLVPTVWIPIILYFLSYGLQVYKDVTGETATFDVVILSLLFGVLLWSFLEYSLHRWIFHMQPSGHSKLLICFHFAIHGVHHKVPFDSGRLVFPPIPAFLIAWTVYKLCALIIPDSIVILILAGAMSGYLMYDMIHFYLHYGSPKPNSYFYFLKRYHNQHHFAQHDHGFGISSFLWDKLFGTAIQLRKLMTTIKW